MALTLTSVIVILVSTVFLVQNHFFSEQLLRSAAHDNARMVTEYIGEDLRSVMPGGMVVAERKDMVFHAPVVVATVCATPHDKATVYIEGGTAALDTAEIGGFAIRNDTTGAWTYYDTPGWGTIYDGGGNPADECSNNGADTTGAYDEFTRLKGLKGYVGYDPQEGTLLMLYRNVEFKFATSGMDTTTVGLYRGIYGKTSVEFATGMDTSAAFQYRTGGSSYANSVTGASLTSVDAVRIVAEARERQETGGVQDITYGWSVNLVLRNGN